MMVEVAVIVSVVVTTVVVGLRVVRAVSVWTFRKVVQKASALLAFRTPMASTTSTALQKPGVRSSSAIGLAAIKVKQANARRQNILEKNMTVGIGN